MNLAVAGIAKSASASLVRASSALLGASGWRVRRLPLGDDESNEVLDEIIAACKLLAMIDATDEADPRREFLCAEELRRKAKEVRGLEDKLAMARVKVRICVYN